MPFLAWLLRSNCCAHSAVRDFPYVQWALIGIIAPQVIQVKKTCGATAPRTRITWASFLGSEKPSLKFLRSVKLLRTNSSPIFNCRRSKLAIFILHNINSLLRLCIGTHIIYIYIILFIPMLIFRFCMVFYICFFV